MSTLKELIESNQRVADACLKQADAVNKLVPVFDQVRRDIYDILQDRTVDKERVDLRLRGIEKHLGVIKTNVDEAADDIEQIHKDITNPRIPLMPPEMLEEQRKPAMVRMIEALERLSMTTKVWIFFIIIVVAASGWLKALLGKLLD